MRCAAGEIGGPMQLRHVPAATPMPPSALKSCTHTARRRGEAKSGPYRAKMLRAVLPGFHPGLVELALQAGIAEGGNQLGAATHDTGD